MPRQSPYPYELPAGQAISWSAAPGIVLKVLRGRLWATCTNDPDDHFVSAGQTLMLGRGTWVLEADAGQAASYRLVSASSLQKDAQPSPAERRVFKLSPKWA